MNDDTTSETNETAADAENAAASGQKGPGGPKFTRPPGDPLAGVKKGASEAMASMEGKTVSMKLYVGTIIGFIFLLLLARCSG